MNSLVKMVLVYPLVGNVTDKSTVPTDQMKQTAVNILLVQPLSLQKLQTF